MGSVFSKKKRNILPTAFVFLHYFSIFFFQHYAIRQVGRIVQLNSHCLHFDKKIGFVSSDHQRRTSKGTFVFC